MAEHRPFPPSARRLALARRAGIHAASPILVGALACGAVVLALGALGRAAAARLAAWLEAACRGGDPSSAIDSAAVAGAVLELALPVLAAAAIAAVAGQLAQTRAPWFPRRRIAGAPALDRGAGARVRGATLELTAATAIGGVAFAWLWLFSPRLAALPSVPRAGAELIAGALATIAIAWVVLGVLDALVRHAALARSLRMTPRDKRDDDRLAAADPRWREHRTALAREPDPASAVAGATLLLLGDDAAVAIAWDPAHRPIPIRTATGRRARATQLLGLARRHRLPVHRDAALVDALVAGAGPVPEQHWPRLAAIVAAARAR